MEPIPITLEQLKLLQQEQGDVDARIGAIGRGLMDIVSRLGAPVDRQLQDMAQGIGDVERRLHQPVADKIKSMRRKLQGMHRRLQSEPIKTLAQMQTGLAALASKLPRSNFPSRPGLAQAAAAAGLSNPMGGAAGVSARGSAPASPVPASVRGAGSPPAGSSAGIPGIPVVLPESGSSSPTTTGAGIPGIPTVAPTNGGGWFCVVDSQNCPITTTQDTSQALPTGWRYYGPYPTAEYASQYCQQLCGLGTVVPTPVVPAPEPIPKPPEPIPQPPVVIPPAPPPVSDNVCECIMQAAQYLATVLCACITAAAAAPGVPIPGDAETSPPEYLPPPVPAPDFEDENADLYQSDDTDGRLEPFTIQPGGAVGGGTVAFYIPGE